MTPAEKKTHKRFRSYHSILCFFIGHDWIHLEATYEGEIDGKLCTRCLLTIED